MRLELSTTVEPLHFLRGGLVASPRFRGRPFPLRTGCWHLCGFYVARVLELCRGPPGLRQLSAGSLTL